MKLSKTLVLPLAALLVVGAAGAVLATSAGSPPGRSGTVVPAAESASPVSPAPAASAAPKVKQETVLQTVLDDLVAKGTITAAQEKAILDGVKTEQTARQAERKALQAERKAAREKALAEAKANRQQLKDFLSDGVITQAELDKLPANSPIRKLTTLMADGKITVDELRGLVKGIPGLGKGHLKGPFAPKASPVPSATTSG